METGILRVFLGAEDFEQSLGFYRALGFECDWQSEDLAELSLGANHFYLQRYYQAEWCNNTMLHLSVADPQAWFDKAREVLTAGSWGQARVAPPQRQDYGALVTFLWDPSGILWHFAAFDQP
ncbi:MAG: VOC family protein [Pseudomonadota bacterium]